MNQNRISKGRANQKPMYTATENYERQLIIAQVTFRVEKWLPQQKQHLPYIVKYNYSIKKKRKFVDNCQLTRDCFNEYRKFPEKASIKSTNDRTF